jgi:hypothetical protein
MKTLYLAEKQMPKQSGTQKTYEFYATTPPTSRHYAVSPFGEYGSQEKALQRVSAGPTIVELLPIAAQQLETSPSL